MKYRTLTVAREFGSGGGRIAQTVADWLGWKLLDNELISAIARAARVDAKTVKHYDEHVDSLLRRLNQEAVRGVAMAAGSALNEDDIFDSRSMAQLVRRIIEEAHAAGECVIVGRGAQCILEHKPDAFHVFIYASLHDRMRRLKSRLEPGADAALRIRTVDTERAKYLQTTFNKNWCDHRLYDLMLRSEEDEDAAARVIFYAITGTAR